MVPRLFTILLGALLCNFSFAQRAPVEFELGFSGQFASNRWNPVRVTLRGVSEAELEIHIDQGSLIAGEVPVIYRAQLPGGGGLSVFEDDVYIPPWRQLSWLIRSGRTTLASGSFNPQDRSTVPIDLILSVNPGRWRPLYEAFARVVDANPSQLPQRAASYNGIRSIMIDGTTSPPRLEAIAAAAASGVTVILITPLPNVYDDLLLLAPSPLNRLGSGWIVITEEEAIQLPTLLSLTANNQTQILTSLETAMGHPTQHNSPRLFLLLGFTVYSLSSLFLLRTGTPVAILSAFALGTILCMGGWVILRAEIPRLDTSLSLTVGGGELASHYTLHSLFNLRGADHEVTLVGRFIENRPYSVTPASITFSLDRGDRATLISKPMLTEAPLIWKNNALFNAGPGPISTIYVTGFGMQEQTLVPETYLTPSRERFYNTPSISPPELYLDLISYFPTGTAFGLSGQKVIIALPVAADYPGDKSQRDQKPKT